MKIQHYTHKDVMPNGKVKSGGAVGVLPSIKMSPEGGGCGLDGCHCSDGHWLTICFGRDKKTKTVSGIAVIFDDLKEMQMFLSRREVKSMK